MAELRREEKEVVVKALYRFGYEAMEYIPEELERDEETIEKFYSTAVQSVRKLLWRQGVRLSLKMAWKSPAMIAAIARCFCLLKPKMGERLCFKHLCYHLTKDEACDVKNKFQAASAKCKEAEAYFDEQQCCEAFGMKNTPRAPTPPPEPVANVNRENTVPSTNKNGNGWSVALSLWMVPQDEVIEAIMLRVGEPKLRIVVCVSSTVENITSMLFHKWAEDVNAKLKQRTCLTVGRFDLVVSLRDEEGESQFVRLPPEYTVQQLAPLIVTQIDDDQLEAAVQKCRLYYSVVLQPQKSHNAQPFSQADRDRIDALLARAERRLSSGTEESSIDGEGGEGRRREVGARALDLIYECSSEGGQSVAMVLTAGEGERELRRVLSEENKCAVYSYRMEGGAALREAVEQLQLQLQPVLPALREGAVEVELRRAEGEAALAQSMSLEEVVRMGGSPRGCIPLIFNLRRVSGGGAEATAEGGAAVPVRRARGEEGELEAREGSGKRRKTEAHGEAAEVEGGGGAGEEAQAAASAQAQVGVAGQGGAEEEVIVIDDDDDDEGEEEGGEEQAPVQRAVQDAPSVLAAMVKTEEEEEAGAGPQGDLRTRSGPTPPSTGAGADAQGGEEGEEGQGRGGAAGAEAEGQEAMQGPHQPGTKVLLVAGGASSSKWQLGLVVKYDAAEGVYEVAMAGGRRVRQRLRNRARVLVADGTMLEPRAGRDSFKGLCRMLGEAGLRVTEEELIEANREELGEATADQELPTGDPILLPRHAIDALERLLPRAGSYHEWLGVVESVRQEEGGGRAGAGGGGRGAVSQAAAEEEEDEEGPSAGKSLERGVRRDGNVWRVTTIDPQTGRRQDGGVYEDQISAALAHDEAMVQSLGLERARPWLNYESQILSDQASDDEEEWGEGEGGGGSPPGDGRRADGEGEEAGEEGWGRRRLRRREGKEGGGPNYSFSSGSGSEWEARGGEGGAEEEEGIDLEEVAEAMREESAAKMYRRSRRLREEEAKKARRPVEKVEQAMVGREVRKLFTSEWFLGMVTDCDEELGWYTVRYQDGDIEDLLPRSVRKILLRESEGSKPLLWDAEARMYRWERKVLCEKHWAELEVRYSTAGEVYIPLKPKSGESKAYETDLQTLICKARLEKDEDNEFKRQLQSGAAYEIEVFNTGERGWGVRARETIPQGVAVIEYAGELVSRKESRRREKHYWEESRHEGTYIFDLPPSGQGKSYVVDATKVGNAARFINHGCGSLTNLEPTDFHPCLRWPKKLNLPNRIALVSTREIKEGEELLYDYFQSFQGERTDLRVVVCKCGSSECRGRIF